MLHFLCFVITYQQFLNETFEISQWKKGKRKLHRTVKGKIKYINIKK